MSTNGLDSFDKTIQTTNIWLDEISDRIGPDRHLAWRVLCTVLQQLRDRLPTDAAAHLGAQLPLLVRGGFYDGYRPSEQPADWRTAEEFVGAVSAGLQDVRRVDPFDATMAVFAVLSRHVSEGQVAKTRAALPKHIRELWAEPVEAE